MRKALKMDKWINEQMNLAEERVKHAEKVNERIELYMGRDTTEILEHFSLMIGDENNQRMEQVMSDETVSTLIYALCRQFAVCGYYWCLSDVKQGIVK